MSSTSRPTPCDIQGSITEVVCEYLWEHIPDIVLTIALEDYLDPIHDSRCDVVFLNHCPLWPDERLADTGAFQWSPDYWVNIHFWNEGVDIADELDCDWDGVGTLSYAYPDFLELVLQAVRERIYGLRRTIFTGREKHV